MASAWKWVGLEAAVTCRASVTIQKVGQRMRAAGKRSERWAARPLAVTLARKRCLQAGSGPEQLVATIM